MSVVGFDLGNGSCIVGVARQGGIDVILNEESKRDTPAIVCFGDKQRFIGTAGTIISTMNPQNSVSQIKRLLGRKFSDPELQCDLHSFPFHVTEGPDGFPLVHAEYLGKDRSFTPTQLLAMVLSNLKGIAEGNLNSAVIDCCIGIPVYFTDLQRRAVLDAATIAGLRPLRLFHETTATALAYGIYKTDLPKNDELNVAFVDVGHASMQVSIVGYKKGQLKMLSHAYDRSLGGRDFDEALFKHFVAKFKEEYKIDVYQNARACIRLRVACEKLKKVLSANPEAPMYIECLMDEKDVRGFIKRDEFEQISVSVLERVKGPLEKALAEAGLTTKSVHFVEVVGSGSRVPAIIKIITEFFGKEPRRTMNASECVARGCALQCAILSPTFKVREFQMNEGFPFSIALSWKPDSQNNESHQTVVFPKGNPIPSVKALTFCRSNTFAVDVLNVETDDLQITQKISTYTIGPFQSSKGEKAKLKVKVRLNIHGIVSLESATMLEEDEVEVPVSATSEVPKDATKMDTDDVSDVNMQESKGPADTAEGPTGDGAQDSEEKSVPMHTDAKSPSKKKVKKTNVPVAELVYGAMGPDELEKAVEEEFEMALQDRVMEETKEKKNAVEAYVYDMRNKLYEKYSDFVTSEEKETLMAKLQEVEDWLYEDGEDETKGVYLAKLKELKKVGGPIELRYRESEERDAFERNLSQGTDGRSRPPKVPSASLRVSQEAANHGGSATEVPEAVPVKVSLSRPDDLARGQTETCSFETRKEQGSQLDQLEKVSFVSSQGNQHSEALRIKLRVLLGTSQPEQAVASTNHEDTETPHQPKRQKTAHKPSSDHIEPDSDTPQVVPTDLIQVSQEAANHGGSATEAPEAYQPLPDDHAREREQTGTFSFGTRKEQGRQPDQLEKLPFVSSQGNLYSEILRNKLRGLLGTSQTKQAVASPNLEDTEIHGQSPAASKQQDKSQSAKKSLSTSRSPDSPEERKNKETYVSANLPTEDEGAQISIPNPGKGTHETIMSDKEPVQWPDDYRTRVFDQLLVVLGRFQTKIMSEASNKSSEILAASGEIILQHLQAVEVQMQDDVDKLVNAGKSKRKRLESAFEEQQEQQEQSRILHEKLMNSLQDFEVYCKELKRLADMQKVSHKKLLETVVSLFNDAETKMEKLQKSVRKKLRALEDVAKEAKTAD